MNAPQSTGEVEKEKKEGREGGGNEGAEKKDYTKNYV
jgi:hypothetical protein